MGKKLRNVADIETGKRKFYSSKRTGKIGDLNIDEILIYDEFPCRKRVLSILSATKIMKNLHCCMFYFQKMSGYVENFNDVKR